MEIGSHVISLGGIRVGIGTRRTQCAPAGAAQRGVRPVRGAGARSRRRGRRSSSGSTPPRRPATRWAARSRWWRAGVVVGLGSHVSWDRKLDGRLAGMLMSIPAVKGVEIGMGFEAARRPGSEVHDPIEGGEAGQRGRGRGSARLIPGVDFGAPPTTPGGLEGGITTGEPVVVKVAMKPIATLMSPLRHGGPHLRRAGQGGERAVRHHRGAGHGRDRRGAGGAGAGRCHAGEVRRRLPDRDAAQLRRLRRGARLPLAFAGGQPPRADAAPHRAGRPSRIRARAP